MFETFVTGPLGTIGLGLARRCQACARTSISSQCTGFASGCLARFTEEPDGRDDMPVAVGAPVPQDGDR